MIEKIVKINLSNGLHIRPATKFVKEAKKFSSEIKIKLFNKIVDAKSLLNLQTLGITNKSLITIIANGIDEKKAIKTLVNLINSLEN